MMAIQRNIISLLLQLLLFSYITCADRLQPKDAVREAIDVLRTIKPSSAAASSRSSAQSSIGHYAKELFFQLFLVGPPEAKRTSPRPSEPLQHAVGLLEEAADQDEPDAIFMLAEMHFYGNYSQPRNFSKAYDRYRQLASFNGNASAQHMIGFMYATGIGGVVKQDQAKALLHYTFAAEGGDTRAEMAVAFRHHAAISTNRNCEEAVHYYKKVADKAMAYVRSGPPGNHMVVRESYRIADDDGGVYGEGASVSSAGMNQKGGPAHSDAHASIEDVIEYLDLMSRKGDIRATFQLAKLYYDGSRGMKRDLRRARTHFLEVARKQWPRDRSPLEVTGSTEKLTAKAAGFIGRMFLRGEGVEQDFEKAKIWFQRGIQNGDALSQYSMGIMHLNGHGVPPDSYKAYEKFSAAADQDLASAQVRLGVLFLDRGETTIAMQYFDHAARNGHMEAYYYLAELSHQGIGRDKSCPMAMAYYKIVAEKAEIILAPFKEANEAYRAGDYETSLLDFLLASEQGFESAQANVAYILDQAQPRNKLLTIGNPSSGIDVASIATEQNLALMHWTRSAKQSNIDSLVKMGDYYLAGTGVPADEEKAASCYQAAAETLQSAQAYWNLGWMHENGIGMGQDFHLAKRFYDLALETNNEAYLPVTLALFKLRARSTWNKWTGGAVKSIENEPKPRKSWSEWLDAFLEADAAMYRDHAEHGSDDPLDDDSDWFGTNSDGSPGDEYDDLDFDDGLLESLVIIGAASLLMILIVYRRRRNEERERERLGLPPQPAAAQNGGLFPQPNDPAFAGWAAGGVGH